MTSTKEPAKKYSRKKVAIIIILVIFSSFFAQFVFQEFFLHKIALSDLPISKLAQGYDIVCNSKNDQELCAYHPTNNTRYGMSYLALKDPKSNQTKLVDLMAINSVNKNYCIKEYHSDWKNQTSNCDKMIGFDQKKWVEGQQNLMGTQYLTFWNEHP